ncbi:terminase small subunit [Meridianimarinicoccus sp. RP-17]|uniref:terminase small subunit n=1 Tax=Meridianimarinicoccus zhengii TaxID=2056810 RepID=UPI0013A6D132
MADYLGIAMPTLDEWVRRGCPVRERGGRGKQWKFNSADVIRWREQDIREERAALSANDHSIDELKKRKLAAEAELAELDAAERRGEVIPADQVERGWMLISGEVRATLLGAFPPRLARRLIGVDGETAIKRIVIEEVELALQVLADADIDEVLAADAEPAE